MSKRKWKVYTTDELRDRFQAKPGSTAATNDDQKIVVPNLKRRNSAPPGMIHFPPGTFSGGGGSGSGGSGGGGSSQPSSNLYQPSSPQQQHELVTHARGSPTNNKRELHPIQLHHPAPHPYPNSGGSRLEKRRASLPYIPMHTSLLGSGGAAMASQPPAPAPPPPSIEAYLNHLQLIPPLHHDHHGPHHHQLQLPHQHHETQDSDLTSPTPSSSSNTSNINAPPSPSHSLPSFQSLLQTIREDADEEDSEIRDIEEGACDPSPIMQTSKTMPIISYKDISLNKSPNQSRNMQPSVGEQQQTPPPLFAFPASSSPQQQRQQPEEPSSPSSKFYKKNNNLSKSSENLPSLSRMSISDIIG